MGTISKISIRLIALIAFVLFGATLSADVPSDMRLIPEGEYRPLYTTSEFDKSIQTPAFLIDAKSVTNYEFLEFVKANPKWQRSRVSPLFADEAYLRHWKSDLDLGPLEETIGPLPVTNVSWFAARAYAKWAGKRLPTVAEWERVALASETQADARDEDGFYQRILDWYGLPNQPFEKWQPGTFKNVYGVYDMHGLIWEWVEDFNTSLVTGESRGDAALERNLFCGSGAVGSSDFKDYAAFMRFGLRSSLSANYSVVNLGFRCAKDVKPETEYK